MAKIHVILVLLVFITSHSFVVSAKKEGMADMLQKLENDVEFLKEKLKSTVNENIEKRAGKNDGDDDDDEEADITEVNSLANVEEEAKEDGEDLQGGDIFVTKEQEKEEELDNDPNTPRDAVTNPASFWKKINGRARVPYKMDPAISSNSWKRNNIAKAIAKFKALTCIDIVPAEGSEHYINIINDRGCYSLLGRAQRYGKAFQPLSIGDGCGGIGTIEHEFMHAIGFFHEQARPDRDEYIKLQLENLQSPGLANQFTKQSAAGINSVGQPYDIKSLMQYGSTAFAKQGTYTIVQRSNSQPFRANRLGFSKIDLAQINAIYKCGAAPTNPNPKPKNLSKNCEGFVKLGLCDYKEICNACKSQCIAPGAASVAKVLSNKKSDAQCDMYQQRGYCTSPRARNYMNHYCTKACFQAVYPADNPCQ